MVVDYENGKVYKMTSGGLTYYGSTTQKLHVRKAGHNQDYKRWKAGKQHYITSYELFEIGLPIDICLIENFPCKSKEELHVRERYHIENNDCVNRVIPGRTQKEYKEKHKDELLEKSKQYYQEHKEYYSEKGKEYRENHKEELDEYNKQYREDHKEELDEYHQEYRDNHKESKKEYNDQYRENNRGELAEKDRQRRVDNKEIINERDRERYQKNRERILKPNACECGGKYVHTCKARHIKSKMHQKWLDKQSINETV